MGNPDSNSTGDSVEKEENANKTPLPRENLISHALNFMLDKKIKDHDPLLLRRFLLKKGLTEEEATIVFQRFDALKSQNTSFESPPVPSHLISSPHLAVVPSRPPPPSVWLKVHRVLTTITSIGGIIYAIYWLWKTYISPYLFGRRPKRKTVEETLAELGTAVNECAADLRSVRSSVDTLAADRAADVARTTRLIEIKSEVTSLKSLLLNRNQFPATPSPGPLSIPAWQLGAETNSRVGTEATEEGGGESGGEEEAGGSGSNGGTNGSDSSLEIVK